MNKRSRIHSSNRHDQRDDHVLDNDNRADFVYVGTALPSIQKQQRRQREQQRGWDDKPKDYSRDAFKGGYSAEYFGTVGSKEGWQPSTEFVSSRTNRAERRDMKPADFMDSEDLVDQQEAQAIAINQEFSSSANCKHQKQTDISTIDNAAGGYTGVVGAMAELIAADIGVVSARSLRLGDRIMAAMGWKPGHGIGPLLRDIGQHNTHKVDKTALPLLPPPPIPLTSPESNTGFHGIGYGMDPSLLLACAHDNPNDSKAKVDSKDSKRKKKRQSTQKVDKLRLSFGTLEEDDDIDDYYTGKGDRSYIASDKNKGQSQLRRLVGSPDTRSYVNTTQKTTPGNTLRTLQTYCNDGRPPLSGFILAHNVEPARERYSVPVVPATFTGIHELSTSRWDAVPASGSESRLGTFKDSSFSNSRLLTAEDRARLGIMENPVDSGCAQLPQKSAHLDKRGAGNAVTMTNMDSATAQAQYQQPYPERTLHIQSDKRIKQHLTAAGGPNEPLHMPQHSGVSNTIHSRFVIASSLTQGGSSAVAAGNAQDESRIPTSAKKITRTIHKWMPSRLLCKRMGIALPPNTAVKQNPGTTDKKDGIQNRVLRMRAADFIQWHDKDQGITPLVLADDNAQEQEIDTTKTIKRPEMELFESIFGTDD
ncbi:hypothetical protein H4R24_001374 [Coemansia sp. RSA 988]|nr:hypothetical protein H4R24_003326 [Coemansia sp. RSA 988]KAJ2082706.1 hypothetical protein H4R24_001374 [Coemansia sp. RSA 988]